MADFDTSYENTLGAIEDFILRSIERAGEFHLRIGLEEQFWRPLVETQTPVLNVFLGMSHTPANKKIVQETAEREDAIIALLNKELAAREKKIPRHMPEAQRANLLMRLQQEGTSFRDPKTAAKIFDFLANDSEQKVFWDGQHQLEDDLSETIRTLAENFSGEELVNQILDANADRWVSNWSSSGTIRPYIITKLKGFIYQRPELQDLGILDAAELAIVSTALTLAPDVIGDGGHDRETLAVFWKAVADTVNTTSSPKTPYTAGTVRDLFQAMASDQERAKVKLSGPSPKR